MTYKITVFNTLGREYQEFKTITPGLVKMYICGPTVYDSAHLGHARTYIAFDAIIRFLEYMGYRVIYVRNITDVGHIREESGMDRMIHGAERERRHPMEVADKYMMEFFKDMDMLGVRRPDIQPRASMVIPEIIDAVHKLIEKGFAYTVDGSVYFEVSKFDGYGRLSRIKISELQRHRLEPDPRKKSPGDFALWKEAPPNYPLVWRSPWGLGFPGWHIECSVMSMKYLGEQIDVHGGGHDLVFPHHENEIAQSEALSGKSPFVRYWLHTGELTVEGQGMHKSLGNYITIREALRRYSPDLIRLFILSSHYRSPIDFSEKAMAQARENLEKIVDALNLLSEASDGGGDELANSVALDVEEFKSAMCNDFNTPSALAAIYAAADKVRAHIGMGRPVGTPSKVAGMILEMCNALGLLRGFTPVRLAVEAEKVLKVLLDVRRELRRRGLYEIGDEIRSRLAEIGIKVEDTRDGERVRLTL
ncbi:Cysteine--tRNA ligase [archaeon HR01]|nr:Cysteine--tRNA ligase [archaeon HR01]